MMSNRPSTTHEALQALGVMSGALKYCPIHDVFYKGSEGPDAGMPYYDKHLAEARRFFPTPVAFYTELKYERARLANSFCHKCARYVD